MLCLENTRLNLELNLAYAYMLEILALNLYLG